MNLSRSHIVGAAPNQSLVRGQVVATRPEPDGLGQTVELSVVESLNVDDLPNFTKTIVGRTVSFFLSAGDMRFRTGDRIEAKAIYRGGPKGGRYSLLPDDLRKI